MAFWGVQVNPGRPYSHRFDATRGRLHISQATIGISANPQKSIVQCNVGDKSPVLLCRLIPDRTECCALALEFEEEDEVVFSVIGPRSVHLTGYYLGRGSSHNYGNGDDTDSFGEDLNETESEWSNSSEEDEYEDDFIDDGELEIFPPAVSKSKVVIEETLDDERPANTNVNRKHLRKTYQVSDSDSDDDVKIVPKGGKRTFDVQSEDEDVLPVSSLSKTKGRTAEVKEKSEEKIVVETKLKAENADDLVTHAKRKIEEVRDCETEREASFLPSVEVGHETTEKRKKKKKKVRAREGKTGGVGHDETNDISQQEPVRDEVNAKTFTHKTENESAQVKEKSDKKAVKASKKKDKDEFDQVTDAKSKSADVRDYEVERTKDGRAEIGAKSDETVVIETAKKAEDEDDFLIFSQTKTRAQSTEVEEKSDEKVVIETKKKAEDEDDLPVSFLTKTNSLNAEVEDKSDEKVVIETKNAEHDDDMPISFLSKTQRQSEEAEEKSDETVVVEIKKNAEDAGVLDTIAKRKIEEVQHRETERGVEQPNGSSLPSLELGHETKDKQKKHKKNERAREGKSGGIGDDKTDDISEKESVRDEVNEKHLTHKIQNGSAEVQEKSDKKVVEPSKKKDTNDIDVENEDKDDLRISSLSMTKGQSAEVEDKSDKKVVMESKKKGEADDTLPLEEFQDFETERVVVQPIKCQTLEVGHETKEKRKKWKRNERAKLGKTSLVGDDKTVDITEEEPVRDELKEKQLNHKTGSGSAEGKEKPDKKVVRESKKKDKYDIDEGIEANKKSADARDCDIKRTEDGSVEVKEKSEKQVVKVSMKNAEDGVDQVTCAKRKIVDVKDSEMERIDENAIATSLVAGGNTAEKKKKKKRKINKTRDSDENAKAKKESAVET